MKALAVLFLLVGSVAYARPSSWTMTCNQARALVQESGAVVMNYGYSEKAGYLYERFVANRGYCGAREWAKPAYVQTRDNSNCRIGYTCEPSRHDGWDEFQ